MVVEIILKFKPARCTLAKGGSGSVIISQLNLVCVCHDGLSVPVWFVMWLARGQGSKQVTGQGREE